MEEASQVSQPPSEGSTLLQGYLGTVKWEELQCAGSTTASEVADALRQIESAPSEEVFDSATNRLHVAALHPGSKFSATVPAIQAVNLLLKDPKTVLKHKLIRLLLSCIDDTPQEIDEQSVEVTVPQEVKETILSGWSLYFSFLSVDSDAPKEEKRSKENQSRSEEKQQESEKGKEKEEENEDEERKDRERDERILLSCLSGLLLVRCLTLMNASRTTEGLAPEEAQRLTTLLNRVYPEDVFVSYFCDGCSDVINGDRYHCIECENFDLCEACGELHQKHQQHQQQEGKEKEKKGEGEEGLVWTFSLPHLPTHDIAVVDDPNQTSPEVTKELSTIRRQILLELADPRNELLWKKPKVPGGVNNRGGGGRCRGTNNKGKGKGRGRGQQQQQAQQQQPQQQKKVVTLGELLDKNTPIHNVKTQQNLRDFVERVFVEEGELQPVPLCSGCEQAIPDGICHVCPQGCEFGLCQRCFDEKAVSHPHALERLIF